MSTSVCSARKAAATRLRRSPGGKNQGTTCAPGSTQALCPSGQHAGRTQGRCACRPRILRIISRRGRPPILLRSAAAAPRLRSCAAAEPLRPSGPARPGLLSSPRLQRPGYPPPSSAAPAAQWPAGAAEAGSRPARPRGAAGRPRPARSARCGRASANRTAPPPPAAHATAGAAQKRRSNMLCSRGATVNRFQSRQRCCFLNSPQAGCPRGAHRECGREQPHKEEGRAAAKPAPRPPCIRVPTALPWQARATWPLGSSINCPPHKSQPTLCTSQEPLTSE